MGTGGPTRTSYLCNFPACRDGIPLAHVDLAQVPVNTTPSALVFDHDHVAVAAHPPGKNDLSVPAGGNRFPAVGRDVHARVPGGLAGEGVAAPAVVRGDGPGHRGHQLRGRLRTSLPGIAGDVSADGPLGQKQGVGGMGQDGLFQDAGRGLGANP